YLAGEAGDGLRGGAPEAREILAEDDPLAMAGAQEVVERAPHQGIADRRGQPVADRVAKIAAGEQGIALRGQRAGPVRIAIIGRLVERDLVVGEAVAEGQLHLLAERDAHADLAARRVLLVG